MCRLNNIIEGRDLRVVRKEIGAEKLYSEISYMNENCFNYEKLELLISPAAIIKIKNHFKNHKEIIVLKK